MTAEPINIDIGADGTVYIDQVRLRTGVTRVSPENQRLEFEEVANMAGAVLALPGGRALTTERTGGRHRLVVVAPGKPPQPFAPTIDEETRWPMAMIGPDRVAYLAGAAGSRSVAIASIANGLVSHRLARVNGNDVTALAGSPDGKTVYYVAAGVVWAIPSGDGEPRRIRAGDSIAVDPNGQYLVIKLNEKDGVRLVRHAVPGGDETEIPIRTNAGVRLVGMEALAPNALSRDGRIAVRVASSHSWYWPAAILDPRTGQITPLNNEWGSDVYSPGWSDDGRVVMNASTIQSRIWRFRPVRP